MIKQRKFAVIATTAAALALAGCANNGQPSRQQVGTVTGGALGAVAGGLLGTQVGSGRGRTAAIIAGSILGGAVGAGIGSQLTAEDNRYAQQTTAQALNTNPPGQPAQWRNPQTGHYGYVEPTTPYYSTSYGQDCRNYKQTIYVEGDQYETATGTACRQPDGTWKIVS